MQTPIYLNTLETFGLNLQQLMTELEANFPPVNPHPDDPHSLIMYRSGQRSVVEWINYKLTEENA